MNLEPRRAAAEEAAELAELFLRCRRAATPAIPAVVGSDDDVRSWFASVVLPDQEVWVVDGPEGPIAFCVLCDGWLEQLYVDPAHTGRGLGSQLVEFAKRRCPDGLDLWTFQRNVDARRFYERHGFVAVAETEGDNMERTPDVRYHWPPGPPRGARA